MRIITDEILAKDVASRWLAQYPKSRYEGTPKWDVYKKLVDLGENAKPDTVCNVIGNNSWVGILCYSCAKNVEKAVVLKGCDGDFFICLDCLNRANAVINSIDS